MNEREMPRTEDAIVEMFDAVENNHDEFVITREGELVAVVVPFVVWCEMQEATMR